MLSPPTTPIDRAKKLPIYLREGVPFAWLIDPIAKTIEAYERDGARWTLASVHRGGGAAVRVAPFDAVELDLVALFDDRAAPRDTLAGRGAGQFPVGQDRRAR